MKRNSINHILILAHHHASNGLVERLNKTIQEALVKYQLESQKSWIKLSPSVINRYNNTYHRIIKAKPREVLIGIKKPEAANELTTKQQEYDAKRLNKNRHSGDFIVGDLVFIKKATTQQRKLKEKRYGPLQIKRFITSEIVELVKPGGQILKTKYDRPQVHITDIAKYVPKK